jgi:hypothetical protein
VNIPHLPAFSESHSVPELASGQEQEGAQRARVRHCASKSLTASVLRGVRARA